MSDYETVKYSQDGAVVIITIFRPDAMNSFNTELCRHGRQVNGRLARIRKPGFTRRTHAILQLRIVVDLLTENPNIRPGHSAFCSTDATIGSLYTSTGSEDASVTN